tara:strand:- start:5292 stop:5993 length:702 start_codon:yes stop_codon:yes gene_type:complete
MLADNYFRLLDTVKAAESRYSREPNSVHIIAVSKNQNAEAVRKIAKLGQKDFGENQVQEGIDKITTLTALDTVWHFIGSIQANKCRKIAAYFSWAHSIDRLKIAVRLSNLRPATAPPLNVFLQVNMQDEATKSGVTPIALAELAHSVSLLPALKLRGLMAIPVAEENMTRQRSTFSKLRTLRDTLNNDLDLKLDCLSMGMTNDFESAIAEGATHIRVGTAIFGSRKEFDKKER